MKVSSALQSQVLSRYVLREILFKLGRTNWEYKYNVHDLTYEFWTTGVWVKEAGTIISYRAIAEYWREAAINQTEQLPVTKVQGGWLVSSIQNFSKQYFVYFNNGKGWTCDCMKHRCWRNRIPKELPQLYKALGYKIFCHHVAAAYYERERK
ncbi:hypothetical protein [Rivularia sp. UHCC 0363]|uniref:hypothetical protein n=1 Tax=Rivularia sp. UHCC 0363 TaxID=3110244 RepID=UPI002B22170B|nr:hypothetical protein [Rivularia sp. UHCC 0363]MEA5595680.1 hypothetical protein [Rivularia sp. UHCC 0363]